MEEKKHGHRGLKIFFSILMTLILLAGAAYVGISFFFMTHFYPNSRINDMDVSLQGENSVQEIMKVYAEDYSLKVTDIRGNENKIKAAEIGYTYVPAMEIGEWLTAQQGFMWPTQIMLAHDYELEPEGTWDQKKLETALDGLACFEAANITAPTDAYIEKTERGYELIPETVGSTPIREQILADVEAALENRSKKLTLTEADYEQPAVTTQDPEIQATWTLVNSYREISVTYEIEGAEEVLDGDTIAAWITLEEDQTVTIDEDQIAAYVQTLAEKYNTFGMQHEFTTHDGMNITIGGGWYGWMLDKEDEAAQILEDIQGGKSVTREPCWYQTAYLPGNDLGNTYIELDYTNQHLYYYQNGSLVLESDIVSGCLGNGNGSPDGVFRVIDRKRDTVLQGEGYASHVDYFIIFAYNVGFHDASWRGSFGGSIYKYSGSHGCINMPHSNAQSLFNQVELGTPVIAYYRESVRLTSNNSRQSNAWSAR